MQNPMPASEPTLLSRARQLVRPGQAFDTLHIVLAALTDPQAAGQAGLALAGLDPVSRARWITAIQSELELHGESATFTNDTTDRFRLSAEMWRQEAAQRRIIANNVLVMKAAIANDRTVAITMQLAGIQPEAVIQSLELRVNQPDALPGAAPFPSMAPPNPGVPGMVDTGPTRVVLPGYSPQWGSGPLNPGFPTLEDRAAQTAAQLLTQVQASAGLANRDMHPVAMNHFLNALGAAVQSRDVPILVGRDGSPLPYLGVILADRLAFRAPFTGPQEPLNSCTAVFRLDVAVLRDLAAGPNGVDGVRVLQIIKQHVFDRRGILLLDHVETLRGTGQVEGALRGELANRGPCLVFGVYFVTDETNSKQDAQLSLPNVRVIPVTEYTADQTKDFIKRFYTPLWERQGYTFNMDAFDSVIVLESGIWIDLKRKTLPYVIVDLAVSTMQTASGGDNSIRATAQAALGALQDIWKHEWPSASVEVQTQLQNTLQQADADIKALIQRPTPTTRNQHKVLTRAHVVSQLLCPNESVFHLPGRTPFEPR